MWKKGQANQAERWETWASAAQLMLLGPGGQGVQELCLTPWYLPMVILQLMETEAVHMQDRKGIFCLLLYVY